MFLLTLLLACQVQPAQGGARADVQVTELATALQAGAPLIDVRTPEEFAAGHVPGAVNLPMGTFSPDDEALAPFKEGPVYVICRSGGRSARAADELARAGFQAVNVQGGTLAWQAAGKAIEK